MVGKQVVHILFLINFPLYFTEKAVDIARKQVADLIGADQREIIFTSVYFYF